ncbi:hypothetical protein BpHYR1_041609 [Brachionus plicatilis]|uniref:Uncharacterized protein n=1 Tax=Brachionus plicatilis TaxID=10195 RepID=A0A3M7Q713_BRAPC|nr:hypothetical protein BpHYR1_041609 [Brachionus plicatilis]
MYTQDNFDFFIDKNEADEILEPLSLERLLQMLFRIRAVDVVASIDSVDSWNSVDSFNSVDSVEFGLFEA